MLCRKKQSILIFCCHCAVNRKMRTQKVLDIKGFSCCRVIPTRCRDLHLKQFCLEDIAPTVLIILIAHIVLAVRWILIKILSAVINHHLRRM